MEQSTSFTNLDVNQKLPNATAVLVLGILSIVGCCCYGVVGLTLGIVALYLAKKDLQLYKANPNVYTNYSNLNTGKILAIIGVCLSAIYLIILIISLIMFGFDGMQQEQLQEILRQMK